MFTKTLALLSFTAFITASLFFAGCDEDDKDPVLTGSLSGFLVFHGEWPDSGNVQVSMFQHWHVDSCSFCPEAAGGPPSYFTDPLDPGTVTDPDTIPFSLTGITLGTYEAMVAGWRKPIIVDPLRDEPVIGMFGGDPNTTDSIPDELTFNDATPSYSNVYVHAYASLLPVYDGEDTLGLIGGTIRISGAVGEDVTVVLTTYPYAPWFIPLGPPSGYYVMASATDTIFSFTPMYGTYYLSLWQGAGPDAMWLGSLGVNTAAGMTDPMPITINESNPSAIANALYGTSPAPHYIAGNVNFTGTRPPEGLLVLYSTFPYAPEHPPLGPPSGYFPITDDSETFYAFTGMAEGTYYVSLWSNVPPPGIPTFYGAYGYTSGSDTDPDPVVISTDVWGALGIDINGAP